MPSDGRSKGRPLDAFQPSDILDVPRFSWRGLMIDLVDGSGRLPEVRRLIDLAAMHKLNVLHLHLTDDQGWRFEMPALPAPDRDRRLAYGIDGRSGRRRRLRRVPHGGFYTQDELRDLVRYRRPARQSPCCRRSTCPAT